VWLVRRPFPLLCRNFYRRCTTWAAQPDPG